MSNYSHNKFLTSIIYRIREGISISTISPTFDKNVAETTVQDLLDSLSQAIHVCIDQKVEERVAQLYLEWMSEAHEKCNLILLYVIVSPFYWIRQGSFPN